MRLRSSGPSPQWLLGLCCPLGIQVTLEPSLAAFVDVGLSACVLMVKMWMLWKILPQTVFHAAGAGQRKPRVVRRELCCRELSCSFHKGKAVPWHCPSAAIPAGAVSVRPDPPWAESVTRCLWGQGGQLVTPQKEMNCSQVVHSTIKTSWRLFVVL